MWCKIRCIFDYVRSQGQLQEHLFERRGKVALRAGEGWSEDLLIADSGDVENLPASDIHGKRFKQKEVAQGGKLLFPCTDAKGSL